MRSGRIVRAAFAAVALAFMVMPAASAASVGHKAAAQADFTCTYASGLYDLGNNEFSNIVVESGQPEYNLYFDLAEGQPTPTYCPDFIGEYQSYVIYQYGTNRCLNLNSEYHIITEETACGNSWDRWNLISVSSQAFAWQIQSTYNLDCIYDASVKGPAIYTGCSGNQADNYENFQAIGWNLG